MNHYHQPSIMNHEPSIINHSSSIINHQSPIMINHSSSIITNQSPINHQSITNQSIISNTPIDHKSPISNQQSAIIIHHSSFIIIIFSKCLNYIRGLSSEFCCHLTLQAVFFAFSSTRKTSVLLNHAMSLITWCFSCFCTHRMWEFALHFLPTGLNPDSERLAIVLSPQLHIFSSSSLMIGHA